jgi:hypothetical protein
MAVIYYIFETIKLNILGKDICRLCALEAPQFVTGGLYARITVTAWIYISIKIMIHI